MDWVNFVNSYSESEVERFIERHEIYHRDTTTRSSTASTTPAAESQVISNFTTESEKPEPRSPVSEQLENTNESSSESESNWSSALLSELETILEKNLSIPVSLAEEALMVLDLTDDMESMASPSGIDSESILSQEVIEDDSEVIGFQSKVFYVF